MTGAPFLRVLGRALRFRWAVLLAVLVPAAVVGVLAVEQRTDRTTAVAVVGVAPESADVLSTDAVQLALGRYSVALTSPEVLTQVAAETGIAVDVLDTAVEVSASQEAGNLAVRATLPSTDDALLVARAVAEQTVTLGQEDPLADASVLAGARTESPGMLSGTRSLQALLVLAALVAGLVVAYALEAVRPRARTGGDAADAAGGPVLGSLPAFTSAWPRRAVAPDSEILASARSLRSGFLASGAGAPAGPVLVVGVERGAGASTVAFLLARTLVDRGESTLVLDLDLDHAGLSATMGTPSRSALHDALTESAPLAEVVHSEGGVAVLTTEPMSGFDDLVDHRLPDLLKRGADRYEVVLCDSAPLGAGELSEVVAAHAASAVVVVRAGTSTATIERTTARLRRLGVPVRGVVLNHATRAQAEAPGLRETGRGV